MPSTISYPVAVPQNNALQAIVCNRASDFPSFGLQALRGNEVNANVIWPTLRKCYEKEQQTGRAVHNHLWIVIYVSYSTGNAVKLIASCTDGLTGQYPLFLFSPLRYSDMATDPYTYPALKRAAQELLQNVSTRRIFSVFGPELLARTFATVWRDRAGISWIDEPYYNSKISFVTPATLVHKSPSLPPDVEMFDIRPARLESDFDGVANLCYQFGKENGPFKLSRDEARQEAARLIESRVVWVHTIGAQGGPEHIACIVAFTRNSERVATITKVFTDTRFRQRKLAERLVHAVCKFIFRQLQKQCVALYVGIDNPAANVYGRVGFAGVGRNAQPTEGVDTWVEYGFDRRHVDLGHW